MTSENLELFKSLFVGARYAKVVNGELTMGCWTDDLFTDDLLRQHFAGEVSVSAFLVKPGPRIHPSEGEGTANQFAASIRSTDTAIVKAVVAELAELGIKTYIEKTPAHYVVRGFFQEGGNGHAFAAMAAWYAIERVRLRLAPTLSSVIHPQFPLGDGARKLLGGFLELPFAPSGGRFVDPETMEPFPDQWGFLHSIVRNPTKVLWDVRDVAMFAWGRRKDYDALGRPIHKGPRPPKPRSPYEGLMFADLRAGHDAIYFAPWRRPEATPVDIRRAHHQITPLLHAVAKALEGKDLPVRRDIEEVIDTLSNNFPGEDSPELVVLMDKALAYVHRAIDCLLQEKGLPPHDTAST